MSPSVSYATSLALGKQNCVVEMNVVGICYATLPQNERSEKDLPILNQEETENLRRSITTNKLESVIQKFPTNKSPGPDEFTGEFY